MNDIHGVMNSTSITEGVNEVTMNLTSTTEGVNGVTMNLTSTTDDIMEAGHVATTQPFTSDSLPMDALPMVGTGSPRLTASRSLKYYVNGELEVARSLGDFQLKQGRIRERHWNFPSEERELEGVSGFRGDVVSDVPFVT